MDEGCLFAPNAVDLAHSVFSQQRAQLRGGLVQREAERGVAALENEVIRGEVDFGRLAADRDIGLQDEQVVEVSGVQLAEREFDLLLIMSHRERRTSVELVVVIAPPSFYSHYFRYRSWPRRSSLLRNEYANVYTGTSRMRYCIIIYEQLISSSSTHIKL